MNYADDDWELHPIAGATGDAYMGTKSNEKIFLKRNTSPFIAALSVEGIVPRLMWTQRTYSGDTLTAQEWKEGHVLERENMADKEVIQLIKRVHDSDHLLMMLKRVGVRPMKPVDFIDLYYQELSPTLASNQYLNQVINDLEDMIDDEFYQQQSTVCHGDLNHNNFLKSHEGELFLVDWENVRISDPLSDITCMLVQYFPPSQWMEWFKDYQFAVTDSFYKRVKWYAMMNCLLQIKQYFGEYRQQTVNEYILLLKSIQ